MPRLLFLVALFFMTPLMAQEPPPEIMVVTKPAPPFAFKGDDGQWQGVSIELWRLIAQNQGWRFRIHESDLPGMLAELAESKAQVGVAALTVTSERERTLDFSHPYFSSGLGIAVATRGDSAWWSDFVERFFSWAFFKAVGGLLLVLSITGVLIFLLERRRNQSQFGGGIARGLGSGLWWSAVTMTTVGYGDKAPVTLGGRLVGLVWMFVSVITISTFTAAITSSLTASQLSGGISGPEDLDRVTSGVIRGSSGAASLMGRKVPVRQFATLDEALEALHQGRVQAVVHDAPLLRYRLNEGGDGSLRVLPRTFRRQDYALAFPADSPLREPVNRALLEILVSEAWEEVRYRYFGELGG